jgi:rhodanese-related sulfurtransferase
MSNSSSILEKARLRAEQKGLTYAGALLPREAQTLRESSGAVIVDVRSRAELDFVGRIPGSVEIELKTYPGMQPNPNFVQQLTQSVPTDAKVMFICRSGARSHDAALAASAAGYKSVFNVLEGFEGDRDPGGHRNTMGGWRAAGLPWTQS